MPTSKCHAGEGNGLFFLFCVFTFYARWRSNLVLYEGRGFPARPFIERKITTHLILESDCHMSAFGPSFCFNGSVASESSLTISGAS